MSCTTGGVTCKNLTLLLPDMLEAGLELLAKTLKVSRNTATERHLLRSQVDLQLKTLASNQDTEAFADLGIAIVREALIKGLGQCQSAPKDPVQQSGAQAVAQQMSGRQMPPPQQQPMSSASRRTCREWSATGQCSYERLHGTCRFVHEGPPAHQRFANAPAYPPASGWQQPIANWGAYPQQVPRAPHSPTPQLDQASLRTCQAPLQIKHRQAKIFLGWVEKSFAK